MEKLSHRDGGKHCGHLYLSSHYISETFEENLFG